ncbi:MAG: rod shape-determining protein RodA [Candidatus Azobacteroides sp.]|nr:rod shape-determining protein RodA [Candidatus Azobacteroides sp.]
MLRTSSLWKRVDWFTILLYTILVFAGWLSIYAASYNFDNASIFSFSECSGKQLVWIGCAFLISFILLMIGDRLYDMFAYPIYILLILILIATIFLAPEIKGSRSWLVLGPISFQPAEFAKFSTSLALAKLFSSYNFVLFNTKNILRTAIIVFLPFVCIILQKETGSALVYSSFLLVLYRQGMPGMILFSVFCAVVFFVLGIKYGDVLWWEYTPAGEFMVFLLVILLSIGMLIVFEKDIKAARNVFLVTLVAFVVTWILSYFHISFNYVYIGTGILAAMSLYLIFLFLQTKAKNYLLIFVFALASIGFLYSVDYVFDNILEHHQRMRIKVTLGMEEDLRGAGYNVNQSKIAIGSGGLVGKGFLNGTQTKLKYVPEQDTDFIFCTIGEEEGFAGSVLVLLLFLVLILRLIFLSEQQRTVFARVYGYCVASILFFHVAINVGMVIGLTPVIGIPLPFFSYGGSSLWAFTILLFIFLRLDAAKYDKTAI